MRTIRKAILVILLFAGCVSATWAQNLDSIPEVQRDSILISVAKETVLKHGPGYYREYKEPLIKRHINPAIDPFGKPTKHPNRVLYFVIFPYDETKERLVEKFAARVSFWADEGGEPASVRFGNGIGLILLEDEGLRSSEDEEVIQIPYQQLPERSITINKIFISDEKK